MARTKRKLETLGDFTKRIPKGGLGNPKLRKGFGKLPSVRSILGK